MSALVDGIDKRLTRNLSGRGRILLQELLTVAHGCPLSGRGGVVLLDEVVSAMPPADVEHCRRRFTALPPREQRRLLSALQQQATAGGALWRPVRQPDDDDEPDDDDGVDVTPIAPAGRDQARRDFAAGNLRAFLKTELADPTRDDALALVVHNAGALHVRGLYERALVVAFRMGWCARSWPGPTLSWLFAVGDADRFRAVGDPLPGRGPFDVYRGGSDRGARLSWTSDPLVAAFFAMHAGGPPEIRSARLSADDVRVYFQSFAYDVWVARGDRNLREALLPWLSRRSDEFIAVAPPGGERLEEADVQALIARVRA